MAGKGKRKGQRALPLKEISISDTGRMSTGIAEMDRVLGGGLVQGSLVLVGGDIRPHVIDALQALVGEIKTRCVTETEIY